MYHNEAASSVLTGVRVQRRSGITHENIDIYHRIPKGSRERTVRLDKISSDLTEQSRTLYRHSNLSTLAIALNCCLTIAQLSSLFRQQHNYSAIYVQTVRLAIRKIFRTRDVPEICQDVHTCCLKFPKISAFKMR